MNNLFMGTFSMVVGLSVLCYASYFMFGWEGIRMFLFIFLLLTGGLNVFIGAVHLDEYLKNRTKWQ